MSSKNKIGITVSISLLGLIALGIVLFTLFGNSQTILYDDSSAIPLESFETSVNGVSLSGETIYLGDIRSGGEGAEGEAGDIRICGDNDGGVGISNTYDDSTDTLVLYSSASSPKSCAGNFISVEGTFPKGILEVTCELSSSVSGNGREGEAVCDVGAIKKKVCANLGAGHCHNSLTETVTIETNNENIRINTGVKSDEGSSSSKITIKFTPEGTSSNTNGEETSQEDIGSSTTPGTQGQSQQEDGGISPIALTFIFALAILVISIIVFVLVRRK